MKSNENSKISHQQREVQTIARESVLRKIISNMVRIEGGTFTMGSESESIGNTFFAENPLHKVTISSFSLCRYEVTQEEWETVMGSNPSRFINTKCPVEKVSWEDCQLFIRKLNIMTGKEFRLPTEAEWEFAARGGNYSRGYTYSGGNVIDSVAWYIGNSDGQSHPVGQKCPNELGLYDMSGNVWEWCSDRAGEYNFSFQTDPVGPSSGINRINRGGSWRYGEEYCRVSLRGNHTPVVRNCNLGLRLAI